VNIQGEIDWDVLDTSLAGRKVTIHFTPVNRQLIQGELPFTYTSEVAVPSSFKISLPPETEYLVSLRAVTSIPQLYLKTVACDGASHGKTFESGKGGCKLQVRLGADMADMAGIKVRVADDDDMPVANTIVCAIPVAASTREEISLETRCFTVDQSGSGSLQVPAGKYFAIIPPPTVVDWVEYAWNERTRGEVVDAPRGSSTQITLRYAPK
jgi:hypothetical protein